MFVLFWGVRVYTRSTSVRPYVCVCVCANACVTVRVCVRARVLVNRPTNTRKHTDIHAQTFWERAVQQHTGRIPSDRRLTIPAVSADASGMDNPQQQNGDKPDVEVTVSEHTLCRAVGTAFHRIHLFVA